MRRVWGGIAAAGLAVACGIALSAPGSAPADGGQLEVGVGVEDASWHVGASAGQYAGAPEDLADGETGFFEHKHDRWDPTGHSVRRTPSYGIQSRLSVRALVIDGPAAGAGDRLAIVKNDLYIPQDLVARRAGQILEQECRECGIRYGDATHPGNLTMAVSHNHSSPFYSSTSWGVWAFQDVFDIRFFEYMARQMATAVEEAVKGPSQADDEQSRALTPARVGARSTTFDKTHRHSFGQAQADDGTPAGYPQADQDHDMTVIRFDTASGEPLANLVNFSLHPEFLEGNDLISADYVGPFERMLDRETGAVTVFTQGSVGTSEPERSSFHSIHERLEFSHKDYAQAEWGARLMADAVDDAWYRIGADVPEGSDKYVSFDEFGGSPEVQMADRWYPGPLTHPYPAVSNCRSDSTFAGDPLLPITGLPDCQDLDDALGTFGIPGPDAIGDALGLPRPDPGLSTDDFERAGIPVPENYGAPSYAGLEEDIDVHLQAIRIGPLLLPICSCEQWWDQSRNIELRTDKVAGNETLPGNLGFDWGAQCVENDPDGSYPTDDDGSDPNTGTWTCPNADNPVTNHEYQRMRAQVNNDASGWNDRENVLWADSEPANPEEIKGNYTHDDTAANAELGYELTVPIGMANDYNGYIATYREFQRGDHYRKALTGWGPHSSDYMASRLVTLGRQFNDPDYVRPRDQVEEDELEPKVTADLAVNDQRARALGEVGGALLDAYEADLPDDGGAAAVLPDGQPKDIERFDAAFFSWNGGSNFTDNPAVTVQRQTEDGWEDYADQSGEIPVTLDFPAVEEGVAPYLQGNQEWHWTARFEAFVAGAEGQSINTGDRAPATPTGTYRFVVQGNRREGGQVVGYEVTSEEFEVRPWDGILAQDFRLEGDGTMSFVVGPTSVFSSPVAGCVQDTVGPIDYPDTHADPAPFISNRRTALGDGTCDVEWFCFTCTWRPWLDFGDAVSAKVTVTLGNGTTDVADATRQGNRWVTERVLRQGETAQVRTGNVLDAYGNTNQDSAVLADGPGAPDADGDGVLDDVDQCPAQAGPPDNHGCPEEPPPPTDTDGDGVPDDADQCPTTPGTIDDFGCPVAASAPGAGPPAQPGAGPAPAAKGKQCKKKKRGKRAKRKRRKCR